jgi:hypothetical protein
LASEINVGVLDEHRFLYIALMTGPIAVNNEEPIPIIEVDIALDIA